MSVLIPCNRAQREINCLSTDPSPKSRLGDIGYVDSKGSWRCVLNVFNPLACAAAGIKELILASEMSKFVSQTKYIPFEQPIVRIRGGGRFVLVSVDKSCIRSIMLLIVRSSPEPDAAKLKLLIHPEPNMTIATFAAGPRIFLRSIHLPHSILETFLRKYIGKLGRAAREMMETYPSGDCHRGLCLCLTEFYTETWITLSIFGNGPKPPPLTLEWTVSLDDPVGRWNVLEIPRSGTNVISSSGSYRVFPGS